MKKFILVFITISAIIGGLYYIGDIDIIGNFEKTVNLYKESGLSFKEIVGGEEDYLDFDGGYYYELLDENEQYVYRKIDEAHNENRNVISFSGVGGVEADNLPHVMTAYYLDHPDVFVFSPYYEHSVITSGLTRQVFVTGEIESDVSEDDIHKCVEKLVSNVERNESITEQIRKVNNLICQNYSYDSTAEYNGDIRSMVKNRTGVCSGYAELFKLCMDELGIDCIIVTGTSVADEKENSHGWNAVKVDGEWKYIDVTWSDQEYSGYISYDYFLKTADEFDSHKTSNEFMLNFLK